MTRYKIAYLAERYQNVNAPTLEAAGRLAEQYAAIANMRVLMVTEEPPTAEPLPTLPPAA